MSAPYMVNTRMKMAFFMSATVVRVPSATKSSSDALTAFYSTIPGRIIILLLLYVSLMFVLTYYYL